LKGGKPYVIKDNKLE